jgi:hypothetical protein
MTALNTLIPADSPLFPFFAEIINSRKEIVGLGVQISTGEVHAFLATPVNGVPATGAFSSAAPDTNNGLRFTLPDGTRNLLQQRMHSRRFGVPLIGAH